MLKSGILELSLLFFKFNSFKLTKSLMDGMGPSSLLSDKLIVCNSNKPLKFGREPIKFLLILSIAATRPSTQLIPSQLHGILVNFQLLFGLSVQLSPPVSS